MLDHKDSRPVGRLSDSNMVTIFTLQRQMLSDARRFRTDQTQRTHRGWPHRHCEKTQFRCHLDFFKLSKICFAFRVASISRAGNCIVGFFAGQQSYSSFLKISQWRRSGSNRQPPPCKGGALPIELRPRSGDFDTCCWTGIKISHLKFERANFKWHWVWEDSNLRPRLYQSRTLTS